MDKEQNVFPYPTGGVPPPPGLISSIAIGPDSRVAAIQPDGSLPRTFFIEKQDGVVKQTKHNHYFKDVSKLDSIDVYRVLYLFGVTDPCLQHAIKKLLVAGGRGAGKDIDKDVQEAIDSLERFKCMRKEDNK